MVVYGCLAGYLDELLTERLDDWFESWLHSWLVRKLVGYDDSWLAGVVARTRKGSPPIQKNKHVV